MPGDSTSTHERVPGYDVARAVAICGMVLINFGVYLLGPPHGGSGEILWRWLAHLPGGRASSLFVTLAGVGIARMAYGDASRARRTLLVRSALLLGLGAANLALGWYIDILHFYACYLAIAAIFFLRASPRALIASSLSFAALGPAIAIAFPEDARAYAPQYSAIGILRDALIDGVHPVVPWLAFLLYGMWLGRLDLREGALRRAILAAALGAFVTIELTSLALSAIAVSYDETTPWLGLVHTDWSPSALYVLSAMSSATAIIALAHELVDRAPTSRVVRVLGNAGQLSLTIYLVHAHLAIGIPRFFLAQDHVMKVEWMLAYWVLFVLVVLPLAALYRWRFTRGPVEWLMRRISGSPDHVAPITEAGATPREPPRAIWAALGIAIATLPLADIVGVAPPALVCADRRSIALDTATTSELTLLCPRARFSIELDTAAPTMLTTRSGFDAYLEVRRGDQMIVQDDDSGPGLDPRIVTTLGPGHYDVDVRPYSAATGPFVLVVKR